jgi:hypothetical protein
MRKAPVDKIQLKITERRSCPSPRAFPTHNDPNDEFIKGIPKLGKGITVASKVLLRSHM